MPAKKTRLDRIASAGRAWSYFYFYHPALSVPDASWEQALVPALSAIESADTPDEYARALNDTLLIKLEDPLALAVASSGKPAERVSGLAAKKVSIKGKVGYLDCRDTTQYKQLDYLSRFGQALAGLGALDSLILDLRWTEPASWPQPWPATLGFMLRRPIRLPASTNRKHSGWTETEGTVYGEVKEVRPETTLSPLSGQPVLFGAWSYSESRPEDIPRFDGRVAIIASALSLPYLEASLIALGKQGRILFLFDPHSGPPDPRGDARVHLGGNSFLQGGRRVSVKPDVVLRDGDDPIRLSLKLFKGGGASKRPAGKPKTMSPSLQDADLMRFQRVAALIKAWFVLKEFSPHLDLASIDFDKGLPRWITKVEKARDRVDFVKVMSELGAGMNDSHVALWGNIKDLFGTHRPPIDLIHLEQRVFVSVIHPEHPDLGVKRGDEVTAIDGRPINLIVEQMSKVVSHSTTDALTRNVFARAYCLLGEKDSSVELSILRGSRSSSVVLERSFGSNELPPEIVARPKSRVLSSGTGYIDLGRVSSSKEFDSGFRRLKGCPGLVLDMRGYPQFGVQWDVVSRLIDKPIHGTQFHFPVRRAGGSHSTYEIHQYRVEPGSGMRYRKPVVVLINEMAQSASEDFCIYLRNAGRVTFVGSQTAGTNGNITRISLMEGISLTFTGMKVTFGDGSRFQNIGIVPDIEVRPTFEGWMAGRDEVLEAGEKVLLDLIG